jgi:hypothetical protein
VGHPEGMTLTTILTLNAILGVALLAGLALVMAHPRKLTPHRPGLTGDAWRLRRPHRRAARPSREERVGATLSRAFD